MKANTPAVTIGSLQFAVVVSNVFIKNWGYIFYGTRKFRWGKHCDSLLGGYARPIKRCRTVTVEGRNEKAAACRLIFQYQLNSYVTGVTTYPNPYSDVTTTTF